MFSEIVKLYELTESDSYEDFLKEVRGKHGAGIKVAAVAHEVWFLEDYENDI